MEIYTLVGYRYVDFTTQDNKSFKGLKLFFTYENENIQGVGVDTVNYFKSDWQSLDLDVGSEYQVFYNRYGKVGEIRKVD